MDSVIRVEFALSFDDFLRYKQYVSRRASRWPRLMCILSGVMFLFAPFFPHQGNPSLLEKYENYVALLFLPAGAFVIAPILLYFTARHQWKSNPILHERVTYEFSDAGVTTNGGSYQASSAWSIYKRAETTGAGIMLFDKAQPLHVIPLNAIDDPRKLDALKSLLRGKSARL